jgi:hypothetical protein
MGSATISRAAAGQPVPALTATKRIADLSLPSQAKAGTGLAGTFNAQAMAAQSLSITLPDGRVLTVLRQRTAENRGKGHKTWVGSVEDQPGSLAVITTYKGVTTGFVSYGTETWELMPAKSGGHVLYRVDDVKLPTAEPMLFAEDADVLSSASGDYGTGGSSADAAGYVHDLLVVYTPASRTKHSQAALESMVISAVEAANQAYINSGVNVTLNLVGLQEVSYTETGDTGVSVADLRGTSDGKMDEVHKLRDSLAADVVSVITEDTNACGTAYTMRTESTAHASSAFNAVKSGCLSNHSLAHEVGHIQGNMHDRPNSSNVGVFPYSYGYRLCGLTDGTGFRTVMSYSCSNAPRVTQFSNPNVFYKGHATGIAYETDPANSSDNARSMNNTADTVAAFRGSSSGGGTGATAVPAAPSSLSVSAQSSSTGTALWTDNSSNEVGFRLERSGNGVDFSEIATLGAGTTSYSDSGLSGKTTYYYRVRAYNSAGNSSYSNTALVMTPDVAPAKPDSVAATDNANGSATVGWVDSSFNETGFEVRRESWDSKRLRWTGAITVGSLPAGMTRMVDVCGPGTFRYSVRAVNSGGASDYAGPVQTAVSGGSSPGKGKGKGG